MEAVSYLADILHLPMPQASQVREFRSGTAAQRQILEAAGNWFRTQLSLNSGESARQYLESRGILPETCKTFNIGYAPGHGLNQYLLQQGFNEEAQVEAGLLVKEERTYERFRHRLMFPILNRQGKTLGFGGRLIAKGDPKYLNSPETEIFHKGKMLYGIHHAIPYESLIVVEGYLDVISLYQAGFKNAVAALGTALTEDQILLLWKYYPEPILCFDGDLAGLAAAHKAAWKVLPLLKAGHSLRFCLLPKNEDPDSLIRHGQVEYLQQQLKNPLSLIDLIWQKLTQEKSFKTPEEKALLHRQTEMCWKIIHDNVLQRYYRQELETRLYKLIREDIKGRGLPQLSGVTKPLIKKSWGEKILLATLINHPTLIEELGEYLMAIQFQDKKSEHIRQSLLSWLSVTDEQIQGVMIGPLQDESGEDIKAFLNEQDYSLAPFARGNASVQEAKEGWLHIWSRLFEQEKLREHLSEIMASPDYDEKAWVQLKDLKQTLSQSV